MVILENEQLIVKIQETGAEITSIYNKTLDLEYMWSGDPAYWAKHSPLLFPIVGELKDKTYEYNGRAYELPRHGFAREERFLIREANPVEVTFLLQSSADTYAVYPFDFELLVFYALKDDQLSVKYEVKNKGRSSMYFSIGAHPAFAVPLESGTDFSDYYLQFNSTENESRWPIVEGGLISKSPVPFFIDADKLPLTKELFANDALVFKNLKSTMVSLRSDKTKHGIDFSIAGFPYLGIWSTKNADFVCIEPWMGIADSEDSNQQFAQKEGIQQLNAGASFSASWSIRMF